MEKTRKMYNHLVIFYKIHNVLVRARRWCPVSVPVFIRVRLFDESVAYPIIFGGAGPTACPHTSGYDETKHNEYLTFKRRHLPRYN